MELFDQHVHSKFSYDSTEEIERFLRHTDKKVTIADTVIINNVSSSQDEVFDYEAYSKEIDRLNHLYGHRLLKGIEIGYSKGSYNKIIEFLKDKEFDIVYVSIRNDSEHDFLGDIYSMSNVSKQLSNYFETMEEAIQYLPKFDVLSKLDYGLRRVPVGLNTVKLIVEEYLIHIFSLLSQRKIGIEINANGCFHFGNFNFYMYAIPLYLSLGGKYVTIGSDAKFAEDLELSFDKLKSIVPSEKNEAFTYFKKRRPHSFFDKVYEK